MYIYVVIYFAVCGLPEGSRGTTQQVNAQDANQSKVCTLDCLIHEQGLISAQVGKFFKNNKRTGPN